MGYCKVGLWATAKEGKEGKREGKKERRKGGKEGRKGRKMKKG